MQMCNFNAITCFYIFIVIARLKILMDGKSHLLFLNPLKHIVYDV